MGSPESTGLLETYLARRAELVRFFTVRLKSAAAAEDLVQEIYLKVSRADAEAVREPTAFLYRTGWNLMLDQLRQQRRSTARETAWRRLDVVGAGDVALDPAPRADVAVEANDRLRRLLAKLETLSAQTQRVFRLHKFEGLSHADTAARLGISRSAVEKHISVALKALAEDGG